MRGIFPRRRRDRQPVRLEHSAALAGLGRDGGGAAVFPGRGMPFPAAARETERPRDRAGAGTAARHPGQRPRERRRIPFPGRTSRRDPAGVRAPGGGGGDGSGAFPHPAASGNPALGGGVAGRIAADPDVRRNLAASRRECGAAHPAAVEGTGPGQPDGVQSGAGRCGNPVWRRNPHPGCGADRRPAPRRAAAADRIRRKRVDSRHGRTRRRRGARAFRRDARLPLPGGVRPRRVALLQGQGASFAALREAGVFGGASRLSAAEDGNRHRTARRIHPVAEH